MKKEMSKECKDKSSVGSRERLVITSTQSFRNMAPVTCFMKRASCQLLLSFAASSFYPPYSLSALLICIQPMLLSRRAITRPGQLINVCADN